MIRDLHFYLYAFHGNCMKISNLNNIQWKWNSLALYSLVLFLHWERDIWDDTLKRNQFTLAHAHFHILELMTLYSVTSFETVKHSRFHRVYRNSWVFVVIFEFVIIKYFLAWNLNKSNLYRITSVRPDNLREFIGFDTMGNTKSNLKNQDHVSEMNRIKVSWMHWKLLLHHSCRYYR